MTIFDSVRMKCRTLLEAVNELFAMGGELEQKVDNQEEELVNMQSVMGDVQAGFSEVRDEMDTLTDRVDTVEQTYDPEQLNTIKGDISAIEDDIQLLTAGVNGTQSRMDDVEESNAQAVATVQELSETVSGYDTEIANLKSTDTNTMQQVLAQGVELDNEVTARTNGDAGLRTALDTEIETRTNQINTLTTNLNDEVTARTNADTTMQGALNTLDAGVVKLAGAQTITGTKTIHTPILYGNMSVICPDIDVNVTPESGFVSNDISFKDKNNNTVGQILVRNDSNGAKRFALSHRNPVDSGWYNAGMYTMSDGEEVFYLPSTLINKADNSNKAASTGWVNTATSIVHTAGNETIAGLKTFTSSPAVKHTNILGETGSSNSFRGVNFVDAFDENKTERRVGTIESLLSPDGTNTLTLGLRSTDDTAWYRIQMVTKTDGTTYATAPATRTTGYTTFDIATAGWVDAKLQALEARITALEGGE